MSLLASSSARCLPHRDLWRADQLSRPADPTVPSGFAALDRELPGGGWPTRGLTELLQPQPAAQPLAEWRLLQPGLAPLACAARPLVLVGPPAPPHAPGWAQAGVPPAALVWVQAATPAERAWSAEQLLRGPAATGELGALLVWLPQALPAQVRRLQAWALGSRTPVFVMRTALAATQPSAAPLRLQVALEGPATLVVQLLKRRGPAHDGEIRLTNAWPTGLAVLAGRRPTAPTHVSTPVPIPLQHTGQPHPAPIAPPGMPLSAAMPADTPSLQEPGHALAGIDPSRP